MRVEDADISAQPIERRIANLQNEIRMTSKTIKLLSQDGHETADATLYLNVLLATLSALNQVQKKIR